MGHQLHFVAINILGRPAKVKSMYGKYCNGDNLYN